MVKQHDWSLGGPQTEKEAKELMSRCGMIQISSGNPLMERNATELGIPTIRIAGGAGVPLNLEMLRNMTQAAGGALHGRSYSAGSDGRLKELRHADDLFAVRAAYSRVFPRGLSLEKCSQRGDLSFTADFPDCIEFSASRFFLTESILNGANSGADSVQTNDIPLYHKHVLCNYRPQIRFADNGKFEVALQYCGPHLSSTTPFAKDESGRAPPTIRAALLVVDFNGTSIPTEILSGRDGDNSLVFNKQFSLADLRKHPNAKFLMDLRLYVARSHFDLASIIDLDALPPTVSDETARVVATILRGEKPSGADWEITVAEVSEGGDVPMRTFHVHKSAFSSISNRLETLFCDGYSVAKNSIGAFAGKQRCSFPRLTAKDMQVVIPLAYGLAVPIPTTGVPYLVESIRRIFNRDYVKDTLAPQWERLICKKALAVNTKKASSFPSVFRLLSIVWSFPRGWMPVAKRVAVGVLADIVHLNAGGEVDKFFRNQYQEILATATHSDDTEKWNEIMESVNKHLYMVSSVHKRAPKQENTVDAVNDEDSNDVDDDEGWHDDEVHGAFNPADVKCKCVIL